MIINNEIYLRRKGKIHFYLGDNHRPNISAIASLMRNIESLGYKFSADVIEAFKTLEDDRLAVIHDGLVKVLRYHVGAHVAYNPMYPNFPKQVMEASDAELCINAILHYWTSGELIPSYFGESRIALDKFQKLKTIGLGSREEFLNIFSSLIQSKTSISEADQTDLTWFAEHCQDEFLEMMQEVEISHKEVMAFVCALVVKTGPDNYHIIEQHIKTSKDVLRLAVGMSGGDVSLSEKSIFQSFKRPERRLLLSLLEGIPSIEEDMKRDTVHWIRLGEKLHPKEKKMKRYTKAREAFRKLREGENILTFNSNIEAALELREGEIALDLLEERAGEFVRRLDHMLRLFPEHSEKILTALRQASKKVAIPVLMQALAHFKGRNHIGELRSFFPKGKTSTVYSIENDLEEIDNDTRLDVVKILKDAVIDIVKDLPALGNVYIDPALSGYIIPQAQRSASKSLRHITRGSRVKFDDDMNTIRLFTYWRQKNGRRFDVDLSTSMYADDWSRKGNVYYGNARSPVCGIYHSGDFVSAQNGASEFIDIDIAKSLEAGVRYVIVSIMAYSGGTLAELDECFAGWMLRDQAQAGQVFEPKTVLDRFDITVDATVAIPMVFDLYTRELIWMDMASVDNSNSVINVIGNSNSIAMITQAIVNSNKPTMYDLFELHAMSRGVIVDDPQIADFVFGVHDGDVKVTDIETIMSEYL